MKLLPDWINKKTTPGRESAADKKTNYYVCLTFTAISIAVSIVIFFGGGIATDNFRAASGFLKFLSVAAAIVSPYSIWKSPDFQAGEKTGWMYGVFLLAPTLISLFCAYVEGNGYF